MNRREHLLGLQAYLEACVLGQTDAVARVSRALEASALGLNDTGPRPRASFLFMGGSGVGKTELTKAFSEYLFGPERFTMLFMNQYQSASDLAEVVETIKRAVEDRKRL
jgi:ATP-dependent Clp protease ATP-binding subunit ClpA